MLGIPTTTNALNEYPTSTSELNKQLVLTNNTSSNN